MKNFFIFGVDFGFSEIAVKGVYMIIIAWFGRVLEGCSGFRAF